VALGLIAPSCSAAANPGPVTIGADRSRGQDRSGHDALFAVPCRAARPCKGCCRSNFAPTEAAALLSRADHFHAASIPCWCGSRTSPACDLPDGDPNASPRDGDQVLLPEARHDIVAHSITAFRRTPEDCSASCRRLRADPAVIQQFIAPIRPQALAEAPKPAPVSYATRLLRRQLFASPTRGVSHYGRYRLDRWPGPPSDQAAAAATGGYLAI